MNDDSELPEDADTPDDILPTQPPPDEDDGFQRTEVESPGDTEGPPLTGETKSSGQRLRSVTARAPQPFAGLELGGYQLIEKIGEGAQGVVWSASSKQQQRDVALKFVGAKGQVRGLWARMYDEAKVLLDLTHDAIVRLYAIEELDGHLFLSMELIEGPTLHGVVAERRRSGLKGGLSVEECIWLIEQLTPALERSSSMGITHRDIKPGNIMLSKYVEPQVSLMESGAVVKLCDFGIAYIDKGEPEGIHVPPTGTRPFMAPEVERAMKPTWRADVFSLAATVLALYQGHSDNRQSTIETLEGEILHAARKTPETGNKAFDAAIKKALSPRPADRQPGFDEFLYQASGGKRGSRAGRLWHGWRVVAMAGVLVAALALFFAFDPMGFRRGVAESAELNATMRIDDGGVVRVRGKDLQLTFRYRNPGGESVTVEFNGDTVLLPPKDESGQEYDLRLLLDKEGEGIIVVRAATGDEIYRQPVFVDNSVALPNEPLQLAVSEPVEEHHRVSVRLRVAEGGVSVFQLRGGERLLLHEFATPGSEVVELQPIPSSTGVEEWTAEVTILFEDALGNTASKPLPVRLYSADAIVDRLRRDFPKLPSEVDLWDLEAYLEELKEWQESLSTSALPDSAEQREALRLEFAVPMAALEQLVQDDPEALATYVGCDDESAHLVEDPGGIKTLFTARETLELTISTVSSRSKKVSVLSSDPRARVTNEPTIDRESKQVSVSLSLEEEARSTLRVTPDERGRELALVVVRDTDKPQFSVLAPADGHRTMDASVAIELNLEADTSGLSSAELHTYAAAQPADGEPLDLVDLGAGGNANGLVAELELEGENRFVVKVIDNVGRHEEVPLTITKDSTGPVATGPKITSLETGQERRLLWQFGESVVLDDDGSVSLRNPVDGTERQIADCRPVVVGDDDSTVQLKCLLPFEPADRLEVKFTVRDDLGNPRLISERFEVRHDPWGAVPKDIRQNAEIITDTQLLSEWFGEDVTTHEAEVLDSNRESGRVFGWFPRCIRHKASDVVLVHVKSGGFYYGPDAERESGGCVHVNMGGFYVARTEVSRRQYRRVVKSDRYVDERTPDELELPAVTLWTQADNWCKRSGFSLPSEAEWEYAASGPEGHEFPGGDALDRSNVNVLPESMTGSGAILSVFVDVGAHLPSRSWCGAINLCGNAEELCLDALTISRLRQLTASDSPRGDLASAAGVRSYQVRGGSRNTRLKSELTTHARSKPRPLDAEPRAGFRPVWRLR